MSLLLAKIGKVRHRAAWQSARDRAEQIFVGGQGSSGRGFNLEQTSAEVAWLWIQPDRRVTIAIPTQAVASGAMLFINTTTGSWERGCVICCWRCRASCDLKCDCQRHPATRRMQRNF